MESGYTSIFVQGKKGENGKDSSLTYYGTYYVESPSLNTTDLYIDGSCVGTVYYKNTQREPIVGDYCIYTDEDSIILYEVTDINSSTLYTNVREIDKFKLPNNYEDEDSPIDLSVIITFEGVEKSFKSFKYKLQAYLEDSLTFPTYNDLFTYLKQTYGLTTNTFSENKSCLITQFVPNQINTPYYNGNRSFNEDFGMFETTTESDKFIRAYTLALNNDNNKKYKVILDFVHKYETAQNTSKICSMFKTSDSSNPDNHDCTPTCYGNMYSYEVNRNYNDENLQSFTITLKDWDDGDNYEHNVNVKDFFIYKGTVNDENYDCYAYIMVEEMNGISQKYLIGKIDSIDSLGLKIPTE